MRSVSIPVLCFFLLSCSQTPSEPSLLLAVRESNLVKLKQLIQSGTDVNATGKNGKTALMAAAELGDVQAVKLLLLAGANVNDRERTGETAVTHAAYEGHEDVLELLLQQPVKAELLTEALLAAAGAGRESVIRVLLKHGVDPAKPNRYGVTASVLAEHSGQRHLLPLLQVAR